jgi:hypothetical protein
MINGAQGDDDEAHGGHFAVATGHFGARGEWNDWLVGNFYNLDSQSEKGIVASTLTMDAYLTDLNSGQAWYRPSAVLVAVLREPRAALLAQQGISRVFNHFYRHDFATATPPQTAPASVSTRCVRSAGPSRSWARPRKRRPGWACRGWPSRTPASPAACRPSTT